MSPYITYSHPDVESDYGDAYYWYELQKKGLGERFIKQVRQKIEDVTDSPETYGVKGRKGYREAKVDEFPYLIVYKVYSAQRTVFVSAIHHEKMDPKKKYRKR